MGRMGHLVVANTSGMTNITAISLHCLLIGYYRRCEGRRSWKYQMLHAATGAPTGTSRRLSKLCLEVAAFFVVPFH